MTGWLHYSFELKYPQYHRLLAARHWQDPLPLVKKYVIIEIRHPPLFCQQHLSIPDRQCENWFECIPSFVSFVFVVPFPNSYLLSFSFIDNVISQVDILLIRLGIKSCGRNISQLIKFVEKLSIGASTSEVICLTTSSRLGSI